MKVLFLYRFFSAVSLKCFPKLINITSPLKQIIISLNTIWGSFGFPNLSLLSQIFTISLKPLLPALPRPRPTPLLSLFSLLVNNFAALGLKKIGTLRW